MLYVYIFRYNLGHRKGGGGGRGVGQPPMGGLNMSYKKKGGGGPGKSLTHNFPIL